MNGWGESGPIDLASPDRRTGPVAKVAGLFHLSAARGRDHFPRCPTSRLQWRRARATTPRSTARNRAWNRPGCLAPCARRRLPLRDRSCVACARARTEDSWSSPFAFPASQSERVNGASDAPADIAAGQISGTGNCGVAIRQRVDWMYWRPREDSNLRPTD